jgi:hypothetical protein
MNNIKTLFLASNPKGTTVLKLDEEIRAISKKIRASDYRDLIELVSAWAVRPDDLIQVLNEQKPQIVHFSGHGNQKGEIILIDNNENPKPVTVIALRALFDILKGNIRIVMLNSCYSEIQAKAIIETIDCVIGMNSSIGDDAAITFAASFYRALGFGKSVKESFEQGKLSLLMEGMSEENTPQLLCKVGVDPDLLFILEDNKMPSLKTGVPDYPYPGFSEKYRDIISPKRYNHHVLNLVFGSLSDNHNSTVVIPINQDFDFNQRGPHSVLASFENITIGNEYFYNFLEKSWAKSSRPLQAGIGHIKYIRLPQNSQSLAGVMFVVTTRNMSNLSNHYGRYVETPIEGIDYILDKVMQTINENNVDSIALPLLGAGYANMGVVVNHPELRLFISELVLALSVQKIEENFTQSDGCLNRGVITVLSKQPQSQEEHHIWEFTVKLLNKEHSKRAEQIQKLIEEFNAKRDALSSNVGRDAS